MNPEKKCKCGDCRCGKNDLKPDSSPYNNPENINHHENNLNQNLGNPDGNSPIFRKPNPPKSIMEVIEYFYQQGKSEGEAIDFYHHYDALGWYSNNQPIMNWRSKALNWSKGKFNKDETKPENNEKNQNEFWNREW